MDDEAPKMKSVKKMYEDMTTAPARPSLVHSTKEMNMADKMFAVPKAKKIASGGSTLATKKAKRFDDGGMVSNSNYPFGQAQAASAPASTSPGLGNNSPLVQVSTPGAAVEETMEATKPFGMKKGGMTVSHRGDGIAQRGKTRGKMV
jgi:hypothetical protein